MVNHDVLRMNDKRILRTFLQEHSKYYAFKFSLHEALTRRLIKKTAINYGIMDVTVRGVLEDYILDCAMSNTIINHEMPVIVGVL